MKQLDATVIGVDLGGTKIAAGRVRAGEVLQLVKRSVPAHEDRDTVLAVVMEAIAEVAAPDVVAIGCGVPSVVDIAEGIVREVGNIPSWRAVPLKAELERRFGIPTAIDNDANAFALGEMVFGAGRGHLHLVGITLGTGLGTGVVMDRRLLHGANCGVGELGKTTRKGMRLEDWCAGGYFQREWGVGAEEAHRRARQGDPEALHIFERYGDELATAIMTALYAYDPEIVVLGGSISTAFAFFEKSMRQSLGTFAYPHVVDRLIIERSRIDHVAVLGAAALSFDTDSAPPPVVF